MIEVESWQGVKVCVLGFIVQIIFIFAFGFASNYDDTNSALLTSVSKNTPLKDIHTQSTLFSHFIFIAAMMFIGFGFLMTFLKRYMFSAVGYNFVICGIGIQWAIIMNGILHLNKDSKFAVTTEGLIGGLFTIAAVLITYGAVLGKLSLFQLLIMVLIEIPLISVNEYIGRSLLVVTDVGDTIFVHMFGAAFGLCLSLILTIKSGKINEECEGSTYHSDMFSMIGTLFLWIFWPSFNSAFALGDAQPRAVVNTFLALLGTTATAFFTTAIIIAYPSKEDNDEESKNIKFDGKQIMVHVQNSTLAGAVAIGCNADLMLEPWLAILLGAVAGMISVAGYRYITPYLNKYLHDTCGIFNLHFTPAIFGALFCALFTGTRASLEVYGTNLYNIYPAMAPRDEQVIYNAYRGPITIKDGQNRIFHEQAGMQIAAIAVTLAIASAGGIVAGLILRFVPFLDKPTDVEQFIDEKGWEVPQEHNENTNSRV